MMTFKAEDGVVPCLELAAMLEDTDGQIRVTEIMELPPQLAPPVELFAGDILTALQGQPISQTAEFVDQFDQIPAGSQVTLTLIRNDSETKLTFEKPKLSGCGMKVIKR
jgi:S1-C subfamily serine protease